jgi:UDP-N-acetylmuramate-alanine ligase
MGIAGSGMSALARILSDRGVPVSGCEAQESITVPGCERSAATSSSAHSPRHLDDPDTFVLTTAINPRHEELVAARERSVDAGMRCSCLSRPDPATAGQWPEPARPSRGREPIYLISLL